MPRYRYIGTDERMFPSLGVTVAPGDEFDDVEVSPPLAPTSCCW